MKDVELILTVPGISNVFAIISENKNRYLNLKKRRGHKRAIIAIARMLLTAIYHILAKHEPYNAELYQKAEILPSSRETTVEQAIALIQRQGFYVTAANT